MGVRRSAVSAATAAAALFIALIWTGGCQSGPQVSGRRLIDHQAMIDFSGLDPAASIEAVKTTVAAPSHWIELQTHGSPLYTHRQWKSPSMHTGVGVVYCHLPIPLNASTVVWLAKQQYAKQAQDGKVLGEWTDALGRSWFEAENEKYHVRGYVVTSGFNAWIIYFGYKTKFPPELGEITMAARSADTAVPMLENAVPSSQP